VKSWLVRFRIVLAALLCLGVAAYAGQMWQAKRVASIRAALWGMQIPLTRYRSDAEKFGELLREWRRSSWHGKWFRGSGKLRWIPRRTHYEEMKLITGQDLGNDPAAWESWFKTHPNLVWDERQKRLAEGPLE